MLPKFVSAIWLKLPPSIRRWAMRVTNARFTVTAGGLIFNDKNEVLLIKHRFRPGSGWGIPGGFINLGEQPEEALRRELSEEINLELEEARLYLVRSFRKPRQVEVVFLCRSNGEAQPKSVEVETATWCPVGSLPARLSNDQRALIQRALNDREKLHD